MYMYKSVYIYLYIHIHIYMVECIICYYWTEDDYVIAVLSNTVAFLQEFEKRSSIIKKRLVLLSLLQKKVWENPFSGSLLVDATTLFDDWFYYLKQ